MWCVLSWVLGVKRATALAMFSCVAQRVIHSRQHSVVTKTIYNSVTISPRWVRHTDTFISILARVGLFLVPQTTSFEQTGPTTRRRVSNVVEIIRHIIRTNQQPGCWTSFSFVCSHFRRSPSQVGRVCGRANQARATE